jgi:hypothetical protein
LGVYGGDGGNRLAHAVCPFNPAGATAIEACDEIRARFDEDRLEARAGIELSQKPAPNLARSELHRQQRDTP